MSNKNVSPGIGRPLRSVNREFPPDESILQFMNSHRITKLININSIDCLEIAEEIYNHVKIGAIVYFAHKETTWPSTAAQLNPSSFSSTILVPEQIKDQNKNIEYAYHAAYTDGRYIYDPRMSSRATPRTDYTRFIKALNQGAVSARYTFGPSGTFHKGLYCR